MNTYKHIFTFNEIDFTDAVLMEGVWKVNPYNLTVQNIERMHKGEWFETIDDLKKFVRIKFNYYKHKGLNRGLNGSVLIETP